MGEVFVTFCIIVTVLSISMLLFGGWIAVLMAKGVARIAGLFFLGGPFLPWRNRANASALTCPQCHQANPLSARYCRRCGRPMKGRIA